jgi:hypothetical protein
MTTDDKEDVILPIHLVWHHAPSLFGDIICSLRRSCLDAGRHVFTAIDAVFQTVQKANSAYLCQNEGEIPGDDMKAT